MSDRRSPNAAPRGYTLVELLVVLVVLAILASAAFPLAEMKVQRDREQELKRALWEIRDAIDARKRAADAGLLASGSVSGYPVDLVELVDGLPSAKDASKTIRFLRRIPRDPFAPEGARPERSWGLRSYQSPADRPREGEDVYDVYSLSDRVGLNGVPLKDW